jgi:hypothetical protein
MTENISAPGVKSHSFQNPRASGAIIYGGLAVGVLDGMAAIVLTIIRGGSTIRMFQGIASGLIGRDSFEGGLTTALLGASLHFLIALIWAAIYYGASLKLPAMIRRPFILGPLYGVFVYFAMQIIVLPLSAIQKPPFSFAAPLQGIIVHILCVGLPIAICARQSARGIK